jgi:hypothetical protein
MAIQPGTGYIFSASSLGENLNIQQPWSEWDTTGGHRHQFDVSVSKKYIEGGEFIWLLSQVKGVCNYTYSNFPYYSTGIDTTAWTYNGDPTGLPVVQNECRIIDWGIYGDGDRTAGTDLDTDMMANNGTIQIYNAEDGGSDQWFVSISKIDWRDGQGVWAMARMIHAERPFVSVYEASGPVNSQLEADTCNTVMQHYIFAQSALDPYTSSPVFNENGYYIPYRVGWTNKKIASLDWNDTSKSWDVTQYLSGPIYLNIPYQEPAIINSAFNPTGYYPKNMTGQVNGYPTFQAFLSNYTWLQTWDTALSGYVYNPSAWWYDIIA